MRPLPWLTLELAQVLHQLALPACQISATWQQEISATQQQDINESHQQKIQLNAATENQHNSAAENWPWSAAGEERTEWGTFHAMLT